jgi:hypothetical protein
MDSSASSWERGLWDRSIRGGKPPICPGFHKAILGQLLKIATREENLRDKRYGEAGETAQAPEVDEGIFVISPLVMLRELIVLLPSQTSDWKNELGESMIDGLGYGVGDCWEATEDEILFLVKEDYVRIHDNCEKLIITWLEKINAEASWYVNSSYNRRIHWCELKGLLGAYKEDMVGLLAQAHTWSLHSFEEKQIEWIRWQIGSTAEYEVDRIARTVFEDYNSWITSFDPEDVYNYTIDEEVYSIWGEESDLEEDDGEASENLKSHLKDTMDVIDEIKEMIPEGKYLEMVGHLKLAFDKL